MSLLDETPISKGISFHGKGKSYFGIALLNLILTAITLGIYYPWAKASRLKYFYESTEFDGGRFTFHGNGWEMFVGMIKALGIIILLLAILYTGIYMKSIPFIVAGFLLYFIGIITVIPLAIVGGLKYRLSRTSWKGIHMGYRGTTKKMIGMYIKGSLLTIITLGIYYPWFLTNLYKEIIGNMRLGSMEAQFKGKGDELFVIYLVGYIFTILTLGIYSFWWIAKIYNFVFNNIIVANGEKTAAIKSKVTGGGIFGLLIVNLFLLVFTLGIAYPWVKMRTIQFYLSNLEIEGGIDFAKIQQTEDDYSNATGDGFLDALDLQLF